jgi:hypothetical protein
VPEEPKLTPACGEAGTHVLVLFAVTSTMGTQWGTLLRDNEERSDLTTVLLVMVLGFLGGYGLAAALWLIFLIASHLT